MRRFDDSLNHHPRRLGRWLALVFGAGLGFLTVQARAGSASAFTSGALSAAPIANGWTISPGAAGGAAPADRTFSRLLDGTFKVFDPLELPGKAGKVPASVQRGVAVIDAAAAVARCLSRAPCAAAVGVVAGAAAWEFYKRYRMKPSAGGGLEADEGQSPVQTDGYKCKFSQDTSKTSYGASPADACNKAIDAYYKRFSGLDSSGNGTIYVSTLVGCDGPSGSDCLFTVWATEYSGRVAGQRIGPLPQGATYGPAVLSACPAVVDFSDPAYSVPGGPENADGKCPTGRYSARPTVQQAVDAVTANPPKNDDDVLPQATRDAVQQGETVPSSITSTGPETQTGEPAKSTTTSPQGTTTTTETPTYRYRYDGDTINYSTSITTTTVNVDGTSNTSTTVNEGSKPSDPKDPCESNPSRIGCMELGNAPDDGVPKRSEPLSWAPEALSLPASCPPDKVITLDARTITVSYQQTCDAAVSIAPWVRAGGALTALFIVLAALRSA